MVAKVCEVIACPLPEGAGFLPIHRFSTLPGPHTLLANEQRVIAPILIYKDTTGCMGNWLHGEFREREF